MMRMPFNNGECRSMMEYADDPTCKKLGRKHSPSLQEMMEKSFSIISPNVQERMQNAFFIIVLNVHTCDMPLSAKKKMQVIWNNQIILCRTSRAIFDVKHREPFSTPNHSILNPLIIYKRALYRESHTHRLDAGDTLMDSCHFRLSTVNHSIFDTQSFDFGV